MLFGLAHFLVNIVDVFRAPFHSHILHDGQFFNFHDGCATLTACGDGHGGWNKSVECMTDEEGMRR